jgi:GTPase
MFIDRVRVNVRAGKGGDGCVSLHREKFVPMGGPDGGNGGKGGDVIFFVAPGENTLTVLHSRPWYAAEDGGKGENNNKTGRNGESIRIAVPPGSVVKEAVTGEVLFDLVEDDQEEIVAAGGRGGRGNASFATPTHQTPRRAEPGHPGEDRDLLVELRVVADIGLVGFPNAGKSTLLNAITRARAKVGDYPFTTLHPVLGTLDLKPDEEAELFQRSGKAPVPGSIRPRIVVADIPGILEGAHTGVGLGLEFLRHIERTKALLFVLDVSVGRDREPIEAYQALLEETASYNPDLLVRPRLIALSKVDDPLAEEEISQIETELRQYMMKESPRPLPGDVYPVSAILETGLEPLRDGLVKVILATMPG